MKKSTLALLLLSLPVATVIACSEDLAAPNVPSSQDDAGDGGGQEPYGQDSGAPDSSNDAEIADSSVNDAGSDGAPSSTGCSDAGVLAAPTAGKAAIDATFSGTFNGSSAAFSGSEGDSTTVATKAGLVNISVSKGSGSAARSVQVQSFTQFDNACATIAVNGSSVVVRYSEGLPVDRSWQCTSGSIIVDTVDGNTINLHLTASCPPITVGPGQSATGTVDITAKVSATYP